MALQVKYEWDVEEHDVHDDIVDHRHEDSLRNVVRQLDASGWVLDEKRGSLHVVLVRTEWYDGWDMGDREWAYVTPDGLPEMFEDAYGRPVSRMPKKFRAEWNRLGERVLTGLYKN